MGIGYNLKKCVLAVKAAKYTLKYGGINTVKISTINYDNLLNDKRIIITGGGSGIGLAIAKKSIECGAKVLIIGRNKEKLEKAKIEINNSNLMVHSFDISNIAVLEMQMNRCIEMLGGDIDILINNAAIQPKEFFPDVTENEWNRIYNTNSKGTYFVSEFLCRFWINKPKLGEYRKIINIDSQGGFVGASYPYRMSKWDIRGLTKGLAMEMSSHGVLVNGIAPGVVKTDMQKFSIDQGNNTFCSQNLLERIALPEEIAEMAAFMMSDSCNYMVGQTILIDGGFSLK